jgi:pimeloyl-ACP methyl ester carboxylesterase
MSNGQVNGVIKGSSNNWSWKEIEIPTPFGSIRGKDWRNFSSGDDEDFDNLEVYVALHGWQDNCGTFDAVIPRIHLKANKSPVRIVAIDLPGHGLSSHYPQGIYSDLSFATDVMRVTRFLNLGEEASSSVNGNEGNSNSNGIHNEENHRKKKPVNLLGHSMGGYISIYFASLFPDLVKTVIAIDILKPLTFKCDDLAISAAKSVLSFLSIESRMNQPEYHDKVTTYSWKAAVDRLIQGHSKIGALTQEAAETLLKRGAKQVKSKEDGHFNSDTKEDNFVYTRDPRLHAIFFSRLDVTTVKAYVSKMKCNLYVIKARNGIKLDEDDTTRDFIHLYQEVCRDFRFICVDGDHHVHLCQPENVAPFLQKILSGETKSMDNVFDSLFSSNGESIKREVFRVDDVVSTKLDIPSSAGP